MKGNILLALVIVVSILITILVLPLSAATTGWTRTYHGETTMDMLTPTSVIQTSDNGFALAVFAQAYHIDNVGYQGHFTTFYELQILKTDPTGQIQWARNFTEINDPNQQTPTIYPSETYTILQTADEGYVLAGTSYGGYHTCFMFKVNSQGNLLWSKIYTPSDEESNAGVNSMIKTSDGGFAIAGFKSTSEGYSDFWLIKVDSQGEAQWNQTYNSGSYKDSWGTDVPRDDQAMTLTQTRDGGYALAGSSTVYSASTSSVVYASWIVKTDAQGKQLWNQGYDEPNGNRKYQILQTTDGGYAIAGTLNGETCLMKTDPTGHLQWGKTYPDQYEIESYNSACGLVQLNDGGYAVGGTLAGGNLAHQSADLGLIRLDSAGEVVWTKTFNAEENPTTGQKTAETAYSMVQTKDGGYLIAGSTSSLTGSHQDVFIVRTETLDQPPQSTPSPTNQQTPTITPSQSSIPTQSPSTSNTQPPLVDNTSNPFSTPTSSQQLNPTATGPQTTPAASGEQNPSTTQGTSDTTIIAAVIITITIVSLIALFVKFKHGKKAEIQ
jgi:hypothetical protein